MSAAPLVAYCPVCLARRTFNLDDNLDVPRCVVCGSLPDLRSEPLRVAELEAPRLAVVAMNEALAALDTAVGAVHRAALHDRETLSELASASTRLDDELGELRDEVLNMGRLVLELGADYRRRQAANGEEAPA